MTQLKSKRTHTDTQHGHQSDGTFLLLCVFIRPTSPKEKLMIWGLVAIGGIWGDWKEERRRRRPKGAFDGLKREEGYDTILLYRFVGAAAAAMVCAWWWSSYREPMMLGWCPLTQRVRYIYKYMCACVCVFNSDVFWANARCSKLEANWIQTRRARSPLSALSFLSLDEPIVNAHTALLIYNSHVSLVYIRNTSAYTRDSLLFSFYIGEMKKWRNRFQRSFNCPFNNGINEMYINQ